jgi:hypothetical protein
VQRPQMRNSPASARLRRSGDLPVDLREAGLS